MFPDQRYVLVRVPLAQAMVVCRMGGGIVCVEKQEDWLQTRVRS